MIKNKSIIIVGAGIGGLATAALLAKSGYSVTVVEKNKDLGGRARVFKASGFTFDMGPSWYMMPEVFEKYYDLFGKKSSDFFTLKKLSPLYRVFFGSNEIWDIDEKFLNNKNKLEEIEKGSYKAIQKYQSLSKKLYRLSLDNFLYTDFSSISSWLKLAKGTKHLPLRSLLSLDRLLRLYTKNDRLIQVLSYWAVFLGASPKKIPGIYSLMSHVESAGVYYPQSGMGALVQSLVSLCKEYGVTFRTDEEAVSIRFNSDNAVVKTSKQIYLADRVIANADYQFVEEKLLHKKDRTYDATYWNKKTVAPSMFILYLGIKINKKLSYKNLLF